LLAARGHSASDKPHDPEAAELKQNVAEVPSPVYAPPSMKEPTCDTSVVNTQLSHGYG
jgi:hypothetical protein